MKITPAQTLPGTELSVAAQFESLDSMRTVAAPLLARQIHPGRQLDRQYYGSCRPPLGKSE